MEYSFPVFYSSRFARHNTGTGHPENAGRLSAVVEHLQDCQKQAQLSPNEHPNKYQWAGRIRWIEPSDRAVMSHVHRVHSTAYVSGLEAIAQRGGGHIDTDTLLSPDSYDVALLAVAAWLDGADWAWQHRAAAFALARPPGHHAEKAQGMGFCLLSNAAIAAHYALSCLGAGRVAILDWDVHHGNGTQALVEANPNLAYCSFHQSPAYPGTGQASETGQHGNVLNLPLPPGSRIDDYQKLWATHAQPFLAEFGADLMIVSAGYDATSADPLARMLLQPEDYGWFTQACLAFDVPLLLGLEGGYDFTALAQSVAATIGCAVQHFGSASRV